MLEPIVGGVLIGVAALLLYASLGRIAGISGIAFGAISGQEASWRWPFLLGLIGGGWLAVSAGFALQMPDSADGSGALFLLVAGGLLVGVGTRLGNGCTSGHGVCGLARLSPRSLVSVLVFMGLGMLSATFLRGVLA